MMLRGDVVVGKLFFIVVVVSLPIVFLLCAVLKKAAVAFLLGVLAFVSSQMLIRIPLLQLVAEQSNTYQFLAITKPILILLLLCLSAGVMEEFARWIMMRAFLKKQTIQQGVFFGLGHGGIEAILIVGIPVMLHLHLVSSSDFWFSGVERLFAITIHVCLSLIVLIGVSRKQFRYVMGTIAVHTGINFTCAYVATIQSPLVVELTLTILTCLLLVLTIQLGRRKFKNEKDNGYFM